MWFLTFLDLVIFHNKIILYKEGDVLRVLSVHFQLNDFQAVHNFQTKQFDDDAGPDMSLVLLYFKLKSLLKGAYVITGDKPPGFYNM